MPKHIRNFSIIAHIDHGKSTLADRLLEFTGALSEREMSAQVLDSMDLERERGITIKAHAVRLLYTDDSDHEYILNLIDTPGHVDFTYEVSRSLASCEGALLVVDASQGVEAQTLANTYLAIENNLDIIPVINKIDLPGADVERTKQQMEDGIGIDCSDAILTSAKEGIGIKSVINAVVNRIRPPAGNDKRPLKALIFDSWFDNYQGVIVLTRLFDGTVKAGMKIRMMATGREYEVSQVGVFTPKMIPASQLSSGDVGYIIAGIRSVGDTKIGDTITAVAHPADIPCPGYKDIKPMVYCGLYPISADQYESLRDSLNKLRLNDSSFLYEPETSLALGFGFRCGFLGLLHMEIIKERLEREFSLSLLSTAPTVVYRVHGVDGHIHHIENPSVLPERYSRIEEPFIIVTLFMPAEFIGPVLEMCQEKRGIQKSFAYIGKDRIKLEYELPLNEILWDFHDRLKSLTRGYASMDYEFLGFRASDLLKLNILLNGESVDSLSLIVHKDKAYYRGKQLTEKLKEIIPRQLFDVAIQAAIGNKIIARETVKALKKDVTAKCYGGDITRKRKLLERQKEGKKRMKQVGKVELPQDAFLAVLKLK
jgi:GTP-binding protein LepA